MSVRITTVKKIELYPDSLRYYLPSRVIDEIEACRGRFARIEEIRLRADSYASLSTDRGNLMLRCVVTREEMRETVSLMCGRSLYAHSNTINNGYVTLEGGIRVGICGRASVVCGRINGVYDISALNIRIPSDIKSVGEMICRLLRETEDGKGVLIYSPPGVGKTTLLRSVAHKMASGSSMWRVALIDSRGELGIFRGDRCSAIDVLSGYPKDKGIEIAARTMNPQLMVCDEIGDEDEARAIISAQNCGVPLLASAHGENISALLCRSAILALHKARIFGAYVRIERAKTGVEYRYTVHSAKEADRYT